MAFLRRFLTNASVAIAAIFRLSNLVPRPKSGKRSSYRTIAIDSADRARQSTQVTGHLEEVLPRFLPGFRIFLSFGIGSQCSSPNLLWSSYGCF